MQLALRGPNPRAAQDVTTVVFALAANARPGSGRVRVFDVRGRVVRGLWSGVLEPGQAVQVAWDGTDDARRTVTPTFRVLSVSPFSRIGGVAASSFRFVSFATSTSLQAALCTPCAEPWCSFQF